MLLTGLVDRFLHQLADNADAGDGRVSDAAPWRGVRNRRSGSSEEVLDDKGGGSRAGLDEAEEGAEISRGGEAGNIQAGQAGTEAFVKGGEAVGHLDPLPNPGEIWNPAQVGLIAGGEDHVVDRQVLAVGQPHPHRTVWARRSGRDDLGSGPAVDDLARQPWGEPVLQGQPAYLPEPPGDRILVGLGQVPPPTPDP